MNLQPLHKEKQRKQSLLTRFKDEIVPSNIKVKKQEIIFDQDEYPKAGSTVEKLSGLKTSF